MHADRRTALIIASLSFGTLTFRGCERRLEYMSASTNVAEYPDACILPQNKGWVNKRCVKNHAHTHAHSYKQARDANLTTTLINKTIVINHGRHYSTTPDGRRHARTVSEGKRDRAGPCYRACMWAWACYTVCTHPRSDEQETRDSPGFLINGLAREEPCQINKITGELRTLFEEFIESGGDGDSEVGCRCWRSRVSPALED